MIPELVAALVLTPAQLPPLPPVSPPLTCLPYPFEPVCPPPIPPAPDDDPPRLPAALELERVSVFSKRVTISWQPALDDVGVSGYRIFRDGELLGKRGPGAVTVTIRLSCGTHTLRVEAVDLAGQTDSHSITVRRRCRR